MWIVQLLWPFIFIFIFRDVDCYSGIHQSRDVASALFMHITIKQTMNFCIRLLLATHVITWLNSRPVSLHFTYLLVLCQTTMLHIWHLRSQLCIVLKSSYLSECRLCFFGEVKAGRGPQFLSLILSAPCSVTCCLVGWPTTPDAHTQNAEVALLACCQHKTYQNKSPLNNMHKKHFVNKNDWVVMLAILGVSIAYINRLDWNKGRQAKKI